MTYAATVLADNPVVYLPLTEASGTAFADTSDHGHTGAGVNMVAGAVEGPMGPETAASVVAAGGQLDLGYDPVNSGVIAVVNIATPTGLPVPSGPFSYEVWAKCPPQSGEALTGGWIKVYDDAEITNGLCLAFGASLSGLYGNFSAGFPAGTFEGGTVYGAYAHNIAGALACWHHYVWTWDGGAMAFYIDGVSRVLSTASDFYVYDTDLNHAPVSTITRAFVGASNARGTLNHFAAYDAALSADQVARHYAAAWPRTDAGCFPDNQIPAGPRPFPLPWLRLGHSSGKSHVQLNEEQVQVRANNTDVLYLPLPTLPATPPVLVGEDASTGRPAFCPAPVIPPFTAVPPTPPPATPEICVQVRCGVAVACTNHLTSLYGQWANWINAGLAALGGLLTAAALTLLVDPLVDAAYALVWSELKGALEALTADVLAQGCGTISPDMTSTLIKALFCALTCTGDVVALDAAPVAQWANTLITQGWPGFDQLEAIVLAALIRNTPLPEWQAVAARAGQSSQCDAMTCP